LIHGGLRYLEHLQFGLVAEALTEREVLLRNAPHLVQPLRFVMPQAPELRSPLLVRAGLLLYDALARGATLPRSAHVDLGHEPYRSALKPEYVRGFAYSDCWGDDARLVIANAVAAAELGARVLPRTTFLDAQRRGDCWHALLSSARGEEIIVTKAIVNAAGAWAAGCLSERLHVPTRAKLLELVQGTHIVVPRMYDGDHAYIIQNDDGRVIFVYTYENDFTLIGTTDFKLQGDTIACAPTQPEVDYLCRACNRYFERQIRESDVRWSFCGIRALVAAKDVGASKLSREYVLRVDGDSKRAPVLTVLGGKITTYRRLAQRAVERLRPWLGQVSQAWTHAAPLPGGAFHVSLSEQVERLSRDYPQLPATLLRALVRRHGTRAGGVLGSACSESDLGTHFGHGLYAREVDYFIAQEWAREVDDVLVRRTKLGLRLSRDQQAELRSYMERQTQAL
jgi:glycerol-3-phosphate dehydrogenase